MAGSKTDSDLVLDFINSLPDSKPGTPKPAVQGAGPANAPDKDGDFLEFLDEITQHEKKSDAPKPKFAPKKKQEKDDKEVKEEEPIQLDEKMAEPEEEAIEIDPISSLTNWWSSEGSSKVTSLFSSLALNAQTLSEQTYQLASQTSNQISQQRHKYLEGEAADAEQHVENITSKLNSILLTMSNQIKQGLISKDDELLNILIVYDMSEINYLEKLAYNNFNKVMGQVEVGIKVNVSNFNHNSGDSRVNLNMFYGKVIDGEKLCFANLDSSIKDYLKITKSETDELEEINKSNIFISIQPITTKLEGAESLEELVILIDNNNLESFSFTIILKDITNDITIITKTQAFPLKWAKWLSGEKLAEKAKPEKKETGEAEVEAVVEVEEEESDGDAVNPSEWVQGWIRDGLDLSFGVVAQEYVIKRMGI